MLDCIKLQTFTADTITLDSKKEDFKIIQGTLWDGQYLHDLYKTTHIRLGNGMKNLWK